MRDPEFVKKAEKLVMEYGPLPIRKIVEATGYERQKLGSALGRSRNLFYMGNTHGGVWYLEHQILEAKKQYYDIYEGKEKRKEALNHEGKLYLSVNPNIHSFLTLFKTNEDRYTARGFWNIVGGNLIDVRRHLTSLQEGGLLFAEGSPRVFRRNPDPVLDCMFGDAAEEIFAKRFTSDKQS